MKDLLVITPSRGRPERLKAMIEACLSLAEAETDIAVALDLDDPALPEYETALRALAWDGVACFKGQRVGLAASTNLVAALKLRDYRAFASLGDDHVPRTFAWDGLLLDALDNLNDLGEGIAYGNDLHQGENLPTAPVISAGIVGALGYMMVPTLKHMFVDNAWADLGRAAACLAYVPEVVIEHQHPDAGKAPGDQVYAESLAGGGADREAYYRWRNERMAGDVAKVRAALKR